MAQRVDVVVTDDFDGTPGATTVRFGLDGTEYEIDLKSEHEERLRNFLDAYVGVARKVTPSRRGTIRRPSSERTAGSKSATIREWAAANGYQIGARGRIPQEVKDAYHAAQGGAAPAPAQPEPEPAPELTQADLTPTPGPEFSQT